VGFFAIAAITTTVFVLLAGSDVEAPAGSAVVGDQGAGAVTSTATAADADAAAPLETAAPGVEVTDIRLTDSVDPATGEPGPAIQAFAPDDTVRLWFEFEATDLSRPLTVVWFHGDKKVARLTASLPGEASQMVFPLPELAVKRAGLYRVEVRSSRDVLAAETFEVT
jgi:hypothetical protein